MGSTIDNPHYHINLEIGLDAGRLTIGLSMHHPGDRGTLQQVVSHQVGLDSVNQRAERIIKTLNQANRSGRWTAGLLSELKDAGQFFRDTLLSSQVKARLDACQAGYLILNLDDNLLHLPWELMFDGRNFLCRQFAMGRIVRTRRPVYASQERSLAPPLTPLNMLIIADPAGDLVNAHGEGVQLRNRLERHQQQIRVGFRSDQVTADYLQSQLRHYDIVHFAGHCDYHRDDPNRTGWRLSQGLLSVEQVNRMAGTGSMPLLVYANACQSARSDITHVDDGFSLAAFGMANAFIMSGVKHHIGAVWEIADHDGRCFSESFYSQLLKGRSIGQALQYARHSLVETFGEDNLNWAGYLLYGNPASTYFPQNDAIEPRAEESACDIEILGPEIATSGDEPEEVLCFSTTSEKRPQKQVRRYIVLAAVVVLVFFSAFFWNDHRRTRDVLQYEQQALSAFQNADYPAVLRLCDYLQEHQPQRPLSYLLLGKVNFTQGRLERAGVLFTGALASQTGSPVQRAEALIGLGRVASVNGDSDQALDYYRQAAEIAPTSDRPYIAQAVLLDRQGRTEDAGRLLLKARSVSQDPQPIDALWSQVQAKASLEADEQRMARIDQLIDQLSGQVDLADDAAGAAETDDDWTSRPITIWLMDFDVVGYDLREGQGVLLTSALAHVLMDNRRLTLVERTLLDKVLGEMKLGTSRTADQQTLLRLGRLTAARLIVFGRIVNYQNQDQIVLRCVDVESGEVKVIVQAVFDQNTSLSDISSHLARELFAGLADQYPLRGKILEPHGGQWTINIGRAHGAYNGLRMRSVTSELVVEILSVDKDESLVHVIHTGPIEKGLRLEAILS